MTLTNEEMNRYSRHLRLPQVGKTGQEKLKQSKVLIVGAGGLGCPIAMYLGAAGIGSIGIIDFDVVDLSNLQRQVAYTVEDVGHPKVERLRRTLLASNPTLNVTIYNEGLSRDNAIELFSQYDLIVDGSDNFNTRYLVCDASYLAKKPLVYGSIFQFQGQITVFDPHLQGPCYRCLYSSPPPAALVPNCAEGGVIGVLPGIVGVIQATEAIKKILRIGQTLEGRLLLFDALKMSFKEMKLRKDPHCALCGPQATVTELIDYEVFCNVHFPSADEASSTAHHDEMEVHVLKELLDKNQKIRVIDVREPHEWEICHLHQAELKPLGELATWANDLDQNESVILYCYGGTRSMKALLQLREKGFRDLKSLTGGIKRWAQEVDPSMPQY